MSTKQIIKLIPLIGAVVMCITAFLKTVLTPNLSIPAELNTRYLPDTALICGAVGLLIVLVFALLKQAYWKHLFGLFLLLSLSPYFSFYHTQMGFGIGFVQIEMVALFVLIAHAALNEEILTDTLALIKPGEKDQAASTARQIAHFQTVFTTKSETELLNIIEAGTHVPEAVEAAKRLLQNRQEAAKS